MRLNCCSARVCEYVGQTFDLGSPTVRQIRAWYGGINSELGFTESALTALQTRADSNTANGRETVCALMLDEMAVGRHEEYIFVAKSKSNKYIMQK